MSAAQRLGVLVAVALLTGSVLVWPVAGATFGQTEEETPDPDGIAMTITLHSDDRASWTIEHRYRLANETDRQAFDELAADIDADRSAYVGRFADRMNRTVATAESGTGREMSLANVTIETEIRNLPQEYGIVRYQFDWHGFTVSEDDRLQAGDAIAGLFLEEDMTLQIRWPAEYRVGSVAPTPQEEGEHRAVWRGPAEFGGDEPSLALTSGDAGAGSSGIPWLLVGLALFAVTVIVGGAWMLGRDRSTGETRPPADADAGDVAEPGDPPEPPDELLSNEERVVQLIADRGGRMKQQDVVEALDWTDAKTSQVVSSLRDQDEIESFRLGRENVLRLPDVDDQELP